MEQRRVVVSTVLGILAGITGGLFGVGGGIVVVPGLVLLFGLDPHRAHPTSGAAVAVTAAAALGRFTVASSVDWMAGLVLFGGAAIGAYLGASILERIAATWLTRAFVAVLVISAVRLATAGGGEGLVDAVELNPWTVLALVVAGGVAGLLAAVLGVGGGLVFVPVLAGVFSVTQHAAQGTSLAVMVPTTLIAAAVHGRARRIDWRLAAGLGLGGVIGGLIGAEIALAIDGLVLRRMFSVLLIVVAVRMLIQLRRLHRPS